MTVHTLTYDDETRAVSGPGHVVNDVWAMLASEGERQNRWHATYNAALTGLLSGNEPGSEFERKAHRRAIRHATRMHGPLALVKL